MKFLQKHDRTIGIILGFSFLNSFIEMISNLPWWEHTLALCLLAMGILLVTKNGLIFDDDDDNNAI